MTEPVRLVVWDLDGSFWKGTVSEGGIREYIQEHHDIVIELAHRGIISSICSKNDPATILPILKKREILDYFVFPSISWEPKGARLALLVETAQLRPETVLFIDDNPGNRAEALAAVPGLQVADETFIARMLDHPGFVGKKDPSLTRLEQYRLMQTRAVDRQRAAEDNEHFLRGCDIKLRIEYNVEAYLDRAIELVNRTNQLNFTKERLPEESQAARERLLEDLSSFDSQAGLIEVADKYGQYGMVGFFLSRSMRRSLIDGTSNSRLQHFCFSCRTLGMGIEHWVYGHLGRPELTVVGEVLTDLSQPKAIDWVRQVESLTDDATPLPQIAPQIVLWGGCETNALGVYLNAYTPRLDVFGNYAAGGCFLRIASAALLLNMCRLEPSTVMADAGILGLPLGMLARDILGDAAPGTVFVLNFGQDAASPFYLRHKGNGLSLRIEPRELPGSNFLELTDAALLEHFQDKSTAYTHQQRAHILKVGRHLREHFEFVPGASETQRLQWVRDIIELAPVGAKIVLASDHDEIRHEPDVITPVPEYTHWAALMRTLADEYPFVGVLTFSEVLKDRGEIQLFGNHYNRQVYLRFALRVVDLAGALEPKTLDSPAARSSYFVDCSSAGPYAREILKTGWSPEQEYAWTEGNLAVLEFTRVDRRHDYSLVVSIDGVAGPPATHVQRVSVRANDAVIGQIVCRERMQVEFFVPRTAVSSERLTISFNLPDAIRPHGFLGNGDSRLLGIAMLSVELKPFQRANSPAWPNPRGS
jgi:FkbH-like protein